MKKKLISLVGLPATGKSTFIDKNGGALNNFIINRDDIVNEVCSKYKLSYEETFKKPSEEENLGDINEKYGEVIKNDLDVKWGKYQYRKIYEINKEIEQTYVNLIKESIKQDKNVIIDRTNLDIAKREEVPNIMKTIISEKDFKNTFEYNAVIFKHGDISIVKDISKYRAIEIEESGSGETKSIPEKIFDIMENSYTEPTKEEGFDKITIIDREDKLKEIRDSKKELYDMKKNYSSMDFDTKRKNATELNIFFNERINLLMNKLGLNRSMLKNEDISTHELLGDSLYISLSFFGVKDNLQPLKEYEKEIKESSNYKEYKLNAKNPKLKALKQ